jgi:hypothetical protein
MRARAGGVAGTSSQPMAWIRSAELPIRYAMLTLTLSSKRVR